MWIWRHLGYHQSQIQQWDSAHWLYLHHVFGQRGGVTAIPNTLEYESQVMTVVVEGRKPQCWHCKQLGHFSKSCPQKITKTIQPTKTTVTATIAVVAATTVTKRNITTASSKSPKPETGNHLDKEEEGWTQVQKGGGKRRLLLKKPTKNQIKNPITATTVPTVTTISTTNTTAKQQPASSTIARGVVVIAVGNEHGDTSSNPGRYWLHFT